MNNEDVQIFGNHIEEITRGKMNGYGYIIFACESRVSYACLYYIDIVALTLYTFRIRLVDFSYGVMAIRFAFPRQPASKEFLESIEKVYSDPNKP